MKGIKNKFEKIGQWWKSLDNGNHDNHECSHINTENQFIISYEFKM